jgi:hypothetical protein
MKFASANPSVGGEEEGKKEEAGGAFMIRDMWFARANGAAGMRPT